MSFDTIILEIKDILKMAYKDVDVLVRKFTGNDSDIDIQIIWHKPNIVYNCQFSESYFESLNLEADFLPKFISAMIIKEIALKGICMPEKLELGDIVLKEHNCFLCKNEWLGRCFGSKHFGKDVSMNDKSICDEYDYGGSDEILAEIEGQDICAASSVG